ncbi:YciI family protein [Undibacterium oligocarboniphilum]|uniref:YCII-related domain-containing protein n=1 Tax=Undibacterium oligocarboniphilum TaxID=666702 RepID=A0A850QE58_9BURK|nr:YciI family protein [Undibacterium oligocarboniphilum]MBC3869482.1 hypothetical protein [Undibacterium oligocarboniphilum]NVO77861.1 hypothetical protein [Undibacterium oligocarboniphilum]
MLFILIFHDHQDKLTVRQQHMAAHLDWLSQHQQSIRVAGSLRIEPEQAPLGACWIVEAAGKAAVNALIVTDPFWQHGLRASVEILHWSKAFPDQSTPI